MVQREIADRLRAAPGSRTYGAPSVLVQLACEVELLRAVDRAVFRPRPRVDSALLRLRAAARRRRRRWPRWCAMRSPTGESRSRARWSWPAGPRERRCAGRFARSGSPEDARAEALAPADFVRLRGAAWGPLILRAPAKLNLCLYLGPAAARTACTRSARCSAR